MERLERARRMTGEEKVLASLRLSDAVESAMKDGIRDEYPDADEARVVEIMRERYRIQRMISERK
jgi:hypothetical protein